MADCRSPGDRRIRIVDAMTTFTGIDVDELRNVLDRGADHGGNPIEPFEDEGWTMRCCLTDSGPGERIAIIAWSPMPWSGPYAETGPIVVHVDGCPTREAHTSLPPELDGRPMTLRPYGHDRRIAYHRVRHVPADESTTSHVDALLGFDDVDFVHGRNVTGGCYAFTATRD